MNMRRSELWALRGWLAQLVLWVLALGGVLFVSGCRTAEPLLQSRQAALSAEDLRGPIQDFLKCGTAGVTVSVLARGESHPLTVSAGEAIRGGPPMRNDHLMKLGSVTKLFTGVRIRMLIEEGRLTRETLMSDFFPDFPRAGEIRIRHLLAHTSGLPDMLAMREFVTTMDAPWTPQELLDLIATRPLDFSPGTQQKYSNSGYLVLALIIEAVTGDGYGAQIQRFVTGPLGMRHVQPGLDDSSMYDGETACGYSSNTGGECPPMAASMVPPMGTGNLVGTADDVVRLVNQGLVLQDNPLDMPPSGPYRLDTGAQAVQHVVFGDLVFDESYHEGFTGFVFKSRGMNLVGKCGMFPGFASWFLYDPRTRTAVSVTINQEQQAMEAMALAVRVLEMQRSPGARSYP